VYQISEIVQLLIFLSDLNLGLCLTKNTIYLSVIAYLLVMVEENQSGRRRISWSLQSKVVSSLFTWGPIF